MTRSVRKTPIAGITIAESDKAYKVAEHRRERRAARQSSDVQDFDGNYGDPWKAPKDGKSWFSAERRPALMRK